MGIRIFIFLSGKLLLAVLLAVFLACVTIRTNFLKCFTVRAVGNAQISVINVVSNSAEAASSVDKEKLLRQLLSCKISYKIQLKNLKHLPPQSLACEVQDKKLK